MLAVSVPTQRTAAMLLLLLSACASTDGSPPPPPVGLSNGTSISSENTPGDGPGPALNTPNVEPAEVFVAPHLRPSDSQSQAFDTAIAAFTSRCVARSGLDFSDVPPLAPIWLSPEDSQRSLALFLFNDMELISTYGYRIPVGVVADDGLAEEFPASLSPVLEECREPVRSLFASTIDEAGFDPAAINIDAELAREFASDKAVSPLLSAWRSCVQERGYGDPGDRTAVEEGTTAMATADAECRQSSGLNAAKIAWFKTRTAGWLDANSSTVVAAADFWSRLVEGALALAEDSS